MWLLALSLTVGCSAPPPGSDTAFAKRAFEALTDGDSAAADMIDWDRFKAVGQDVGVVYRGMTDETEKSQFRTGFLVGFSKSFKGQGADASQLSNWRVLNENTSETVVSAEASNGNKILITVTKRNGQQLISALNLDMY